MEARAIPQSLGDGTFLPRIHTRCIHRDPVLPWIPGEISKKSQSIAKENPAGTVHRELSQKSIANRVTRFTFVSTFPSEVNEQRRSSVRRTSGIEIKFMAGHRRGGSRRFYTKWTVPLFRRLTGRRFPPSSFISSDRIGTYSRGLCRTKLPSHARFRGCFPLRLRIVGE